MATMEELSRTLSPTLAKQLADTFSKEAFGADGPELDCDIDEIEEVAVLAAKATFDAVIARALVLQNRKLPDKLPCPTCEEQCLVKFIERIVRGRIGPTTIQEPVCHCSTCDRDFFPSAGNIAAG